jgi:predicted nucleotidyltransferase
MQRNTSLKVIPIKEVDLLAMPFIDQYTKEIQMLCVQHHVKKLYVFGSVLNDDFTSESDIDFIVDFEPLDVNQYADNYFNLKFALEDTLHQPVDLLEKKL